jgi:hypothetical protein
VSCADCRRNALKALRSLVAGLHHYLDAEGIRTFPAVQELCDVLGSSEEDRRQVANIARPPAPEQLLVHQAYHQAQLRSFLGYAVPRLHLRWLEEGKSIDEVIEMGRSTADVIAENGAVIVDADVLAPKNGRKRTCEQFAKARESLAVACAAGAFTPGGITCMEMHWEVPAREWEVALKSVAELRNQERAVPKRSPRATP